MRVLVVEDDPDLRTLMWRIFADRRHEVAVAADGAEAIEKVHSLRPELVLLDLVMPGLDGWAVLRNIRRLPAPPPVVMLSVQTQAEIYTRALGEGVAAFVEKPFAVAELLATCERVVGQEAPAASVPRDRRVTRRRVVQVPAQVLAQEQGWWTNGELVDLGRGGARLAMPVPLPGGGTVRVAFALPGEATRLSVEGRLQWRTPEARGFAYGLSFVDVRPEAQRLIDALVDGPAGE
jgi:CheY-like chemotaxis protein